jgi:LAO/AO transport system ATPase
MNPLPSLVERIRSGDRRALAQTISTVENETSRAAEILASLASHAGHAHVVGVTGPPGAGKSTLVAALAAELVTRGQRVAVVAVDPTSPLSGGALLGDRIRMAELSDEDRVYIRSLASRGHPGGLSRATRGIVAVLDAAGFDTVLVETVGAGQSEVDIRNVAHTCVVVCPPGLGDDVQALKAGMLEIADLYVINKADLAGARRTEREMLDMIALRSASTGRREHPPVIRTVATRKEGIVELADAIGPRPSGAGTGGADL